MEPRVQRDGAISSQAASKTPSKTWLYAALALIGVLLVVWAAWPKHSPAARETARNLAPRTAVPAGNRGTNRGAWETRTLGPEGSAAKSQPKALPARVETVPRREVTPAKAGPAAVNGEVWRVVVYTYNHAEDAQRKARSLNAQHPDLAADVFSPDGRGAPYLVTVGGQMNRADALRLRQRVGRMGMPRDSYIQNYKR